MRGGLKDQLSQTLKDYDRVAGNLTDTAHQLQLTIGDLRPGLRNFVQTTLPGVDDFVNDAQLLAGNLNQFVVQLQRDPTRLLFGIGAKGISRDETPRFQDCPRMAGGQRIPRARRVREPVRRDTTRQALSTCAERQLPGQPAACPRELLVDLPQAPAGIDTSRIALSKSPLSLDYYADAAWTDQAPALIETALLASFENTGAITAIDRELTGLRADFILRTEICHFEAVYDPPAAHHVSGSRSSPGSSRCRSARSSPKPNSSNAPPPPRTAFRP